MMTRVISRYRITLFLFTLLACIAAPLRAQQDLIPAPPQVNADAWLLMDALSGEVLASQNADKHLPPASLTKLMTSYVLSWELAKGHVSGDDQVPISKNAWAQNPVFEGSSLMWIEVGKEVSLEDLHRGIVVASGNDASVAVAEHLAGSESAFADVMNRHAELLGLENTHFANAHGLPHPEHHTSAGDLAKLARALLRFPEQYALYAEREFTYNNITQSNRNRLLWRDPSVDGLKTGHTREAGYGLVASAKRGDMRLITVVLGTPSVNARETETQKLLAWGFRYFETHRIYEPGAELRKVRVWGGAGEEVPVGVSEAVVLTVPRGRHDALQAVMHLDEVIRAPIEAGQELGELEVSLDGDVLASQPLVAMEAMESGGFFRRIWHSVLLFLQGLFA